VENPASGLAERRNCLLTHTKRKVGATLTVRLGKKMSLKKSQKSLKKWTKQDWQTKSGEPSAKTGERYLPKGAIMALSAEEYNRTTAKKREDTKKGKQFSKQPKSIAKKTKRHR